MQKFINFISSIKKKLFCADFLLLSVIVISIILIGTTGFALHQIRQNANHLMLNQFNQVNHNLLKLSNQLESKLAVTPQQIDALKQQLDSIQNILSKLNQSEEIKQLEKIISQNNTAVLNKLNTMQAKQQNQKTLKRSAVKQRYLSSNSLPFKVISIDVWNDNPEVSILDNHGDYQLIGENENYLGWTLTSVSYDPALAIFKNGQHAEIKVRL